MKDVFSLHHEQDALVCALISLAIAAEQGKTNKKRTVDLILDGLFAVTTNVSFNLKSVKQLTREAQALAGGKPMRPEALFSGSDDPARLRSTLQFGLRGMASCAHHTRLLGKRTEEIDDAFISATASIANTRTLWEWMELLTQLGRISAIHIHASA